MWNKKDEDFKAPELPAARPAQEPPRAAFEPARGGTMEPVGKIGKSILIRGELSGNEDLTIEGNVEGKIELKDHNLVVGSTGKIQAEIHAKAVTIQGEVTGNVRAEDRIEISTSGTVKGDLVAPRIIISDGARFKGSVDMEKPGEGVRPRPAMASMANDVRAAVSASSVETRTAKA